MAKSYPHWRGNPSPQAGVVAGTLGVWTLFDYAGEPGPWPLVVSSFGQFDLAGFAKSASYWYAKPETANHHLLVVESPGLYQILSASVSFAARTEGPHVCMCRT